MKMHVAFLLSAVAATQTPQAVTPTVVATALSADRVAIYRQFLISDPGLPESASTLNVSLVTEPFLHNDFIDPDRSCLAAAHIFELSTPELHKLPSDAFPDTRVHLVDLYMPPPPPPPPNRSVATKTLAIFHRAPAQTAPPVRPDSLITLSEIVFDASHAHAAFRYAYTSGPNAAKGATAIYDLDHDTWKPSKSSCTEWAR